MKYTNEHGIALPIAVWLLHDEYDSQAHIPNYVSATSLLAPTKQFILSRRIPYEDRTMDVSDLIASSYGTALHDSIEKAWVKAGPRIMKALGYPDHICEKIVVNPEPEWWELNKDNGYLPVYVEQRYFREIVVDGVTYTIGGKADIIIDSRLFDNKSTSVWTYLLGGKDEDYSRQGSVYRWISPDKIIDDYIYIEFLFTDWKKADSLSNPNYPKLRTLEYPVQMMSLDQTEEFIRSKLALLKRYANAKEEDMPECTDEELWRSAPQYKYYADPTKMARSTKNFDNLADANKFMAEKGGKGIVVTKPGEVKRCGFCPAYDICKQKDKYLTDV